MVSASKEESLIYGLKISSVGPGMISGQDSVYDPKNVDLAMKLHYLRGVYYFKSQVFQGLTTMDIKGASFSWLNHFYVTCGRFRRHESSGRPYIKCNDCGARFIEAQCVKTLDEWLQIINEDQHKDQENNESSLQKLLVSSQVIGPELHFSPLVFIQLTRFKCGGVSVGLSWAHIIGDAFSATNFINAWGQVMAGLQPAQPIKLAQSNTKTETSPSPPKSSEDPLSVKRVGPVGDHWTTPNNCKMETFSFLLSTTQISHLQAKVCGPAGSDQIPVFEVLCAVIWKVVAKIRLGSEPRVVTICKNDSHAHKKDTLCNGQVISIVKADFSIMEANPKKLADLVINEAQEEQSKIDEEVERDKGLSDFIVYGANLTFVDLEEANLYGLEMKGQKPVYAGYTIDGVGEEGAVLLLPGPNDGKERKLVTLIMPENQVLELKSELKREFSVA